MLCEPLEQRLLLTANRLQDLFSTDAMIGDLNLQRTIVPGELVVAYQSNRDQDSDFDGLAMLSAHLEQSLLQESELWGQEFLHLDDSSERPLDLFHFQFDAGSDLLELATSTLELPGVAWVAPNYQYSGGIYDFFPNDPLANSQYHHALIGSASGWDVTLGDPNVVIAVTDDGVQLNHPDLAANIWQNTVELAGTPGVDDDLNGFVDDFHGWDFVAGDNDPSPINNGDDHGTHVAGIAAGVTNNNNQIAGVSGGSTIMPIKIAGGGGFTSTIMANAFTYAINNGARIANTSYNINGFVGDPTFTAGLQYYHDNGGIHFNSAGNSNELNPARQAFEQTILVASTTVSDAKSSFSNYGTGVDIAAPGSSILSTVTAGGTGTKSGTSMAAPNAAGAAALIWSANPTWTRDQVIAYLLATADNIDAANPSYIGLLGSGRINISDLSAVLAPPQVAQLTGLPADGTTVNANAVIDQFVIRFDQLMDLAGVNDSANFSLAEAGPNGIAGDGDDVAVPISATSTYMIGSNEFGFTIDGGALGIGKYVLTINATLANPFGTPLDGDGDGTAGDSYQTFFDVVAPPPIPVAPLGSLIYDRPIDGNIGSSGEVDIHTIDLDAGERLTVIVEPGSSLTPSVDVIGPGGSLGSASSGSAGQDLVLQSLAITTPGSYSIEITGDSGTTGSYTLELLLGADAELESHGGTTNDTLGTAQDIDGSAVDLGFGVADRLAVIGQLPATSGSDWYRFTTSPGGANTLALTQLDAGNASLELYDSGGNLVSIGVPSENVDQVISQYRTGAPATHYARVFGTAAAYSLLITGDSDFDREANDGGVVQDLSPLTNATVLGAVVDSAANDLEPDDYADGSVLDSVNSAVTLSNNIGGGSIYAAAASFGAPTGGRVFAPSPGAASGFSDLDNELRADFASPTDFVSIDAGSDDSSDVSVLQVYSAGGTLLDQVTSGAISSGNSETLSITRPSADIAYAIAFGLGGDISPLDNLRFGGIGNDDFYTVDVTTGDILTINTSTPGGGPLQPNNLLDPGIELFDPTGAPVAHTNVAGDESLVHTASLTGQYTVRLFSEANNGAYVLNIGGRTPNLPLLQVTATNPFDGQTLNAAPSEITVDFSTPLLLTSVDAADLTVNGVPAVSVTVVDADTLRFQIGSLGDGTHLIQIAGGALTNLQTSAVEPFSSQFELDIVPAPLQIIDNGDSGYSTTGSEWFSGTGYGHDSDFQLNPAGTGSEIAEWTFTDLTPGLYRVSATWIESADLATDAPFSIFDGASPLATVTVNQQLAPEDFRYQGTDWHFLGDLYEITGNSLTVQLSDAADNTVLADAIHLEQVPGIIIDNGDSGYSSVGADWLTAATGFGFDGDIDLHAPGSGTEFGRWTFSGLTPGNYRVSATWFPIPELATDAPFTVYDGGAPLSTVTVNQQLPPSSTREGGVLWEQLGGIYSITGGELVVELSNAADGIVLADAIHIERLAGTIMDDGDSGYSTTAGWFPLAIGLGYGYEGDFDVGDPGAGTEIATWTFSGLTPGLFRVAATWLPLSGLATDAPFTVLDGANPLGTVDIDLTQQPNELASGGAFWKVLGAAFEITGNTLVVQLNDAADALLLADAIRIERVGELPDLSEGIAAGSSIGERPDSEVPTVVDMINGSQAVNVPLSAGASFQLMASPARSAPLPGLPVEDAASYQLVFAAAPQPSGSSAAVDHAANPRHRLDRSDDESRSDRFAASADQYFRLLNLEDRLLTTA